MSLASEEVQTSGLRLPLSSREVYLAGTGSYMSAPSFREILLVTAICNSAALVALFKRYSKFGPNVGWC